MQLDVENLTCGYDGTRVLDALSFGLAEGELGCLLGESGCGKTTALRAIAGFEKPEAGTIDVGGRRVSGPGVHVAPQARGVGMVFQSYALFTHLDVRANVGFGLRGRPRAERDAQVARLLELTGLVECADRYVHQLSGGQRQRVALARALAPEPALLLLDEPFSNLDEALRQRLSRQVRDILRELGTTALLVTHDQREAFAMADRLGVLRNGRVEQWGAPQALYRQPASRFVARFVGRGGFLPGIVSADGRVQTEIGTMCCAVPPAAPPGAQVDVLVRPDHVRLTERGVDARVRDAAFRGTMTLYTLALPSGATLQALIASASRRADGETLRIAATDVPTVTFPQSE